MAINPKKPDLTNLHLKYLGKDLKPKFGDAEIIAMDRSHSVIEEPLLYLPSALSSFCLPVLFLPAGGSINNLFALSLLWTLSSFMPVLVRALHCLLDC